MSKSCVTDIPNRAHANVRTSLPIATRESHCADWKGLEPGGSLPGAYDIRRRAPGAAREQEELTEGAAASVEDVNDPEALGTITAELASTRQAPVIEGVKATTPGISRGFLLLGFIALVLVLCTVIPLVTSGRKGSNVTGQDTTLSSPLPPYEEGNLTLTIADVLLSTEAKYQRGALSIFSVPFGQVYLEIVNQTDQKFTFFGIDSNLEFLAGLPVSLIGKLLSSVWNGHKLDVLKYITIAGQSLEVQSIYDGMVVESMAGYPLIFHLDPLRVNNISISERGRNKQYKNGIEHVLLGYFRPFAPWIGKSILDTLIETNEQYNGTLSTFLDLINAFPLVKEQLQLEEANTDATTLFVPTNNGLATLLPELTFQGQYALDPTLEELILNHIVSGNFAKSCWWIIPTGEILSETELRLESQSGLVLDLEISDDVIINGYARIIQEDIFSEQGVIHIIDTPFVGI